MDYSFEKITVTQVMYEVALHLKDCEQLDDHTRRQLLELLDTYKPENQQYTSFSLILKLYNCLLQSPITDKRISLHDILNGTEIILPCYEPPKRNPELVARLEKIKARLAHQEYNRMVQNLNPSSQMSQFNKPGLEVKEAYKQIALVLNMALTVGCCFAFGYFAAYYSSLATDMCILTGAALAFVVFIAEIYFIATR